MDILRKMFKNAKDNEDGEKNKDAPVKDEFRKPQWFEEAETDDELFDDDRKFAFQIFTNPMELQKHFEHQMQQILESINEMEENNVKIDKNLKEDFLKPGFEKSIFKEFDEHTERKNLADTDLDGEIHADQLHSLIQRFNPGDKDLPSVLPRNDSMKRQLKLNKKKLTDEEIILGKIHGTLIDTQGARKPHAPRLPQNKTTPNAQMKPGTVTPFGGVFDGNYQGPKMFRQSVISKTVRKPDGSYETTKVTEDSHGNRRTTVTRTVNGKSETVTTFDGFGGSGSFKQKQNDCKPDLQSYSDRNIFVTKEGYAMPRNLWRNILLDSELLASLRANAIASFAEIVQRNEGRMKKICMAFDIHTECESGKNEEF